MPDSLRLALHVADDAEGFADLVDRFMADDVFASEQRVATAGAAEAAWREQRAYAAQFVAWVNRRVAEPPLPRRM
jgi:serine/threonine protein kinase HipA of HipAB toxin-antitoxin module